MPVVDYKAYCRMLDSANQNKYAYPAINVSNLETANAALAGFAEAKSDGIIQVSTGGGEHASGSKVKDMVLGAISLANHVHLMAEKYQVNIALHTDHCPQDKLEGFVLPGELVQMRLQRHESNLLSSFRHTEIGTGCRTCRSVFCC